MGTVKPFLMTSRSWPQRSLTWRPSEIGCRFRDASSSNKIVFRMLHRHPASVVKLQTKDAFARFCATGISTKHRPDRAPQSRRWTPFTVVCPTHTRLIPNEVRTTRNLSKLWLLIWRNLSLGCFGYSGCDFSGFFTSVDFVSKVIFFDKIISRLRNKFLAKLKHPRKEQQGWHHTIELKTADQNQSCIGSNINCWVPKSLFDSVLLLMRFEATFFNFTADSHTLASQSKRFVSHTASSRPIFLPMKRQSASSVQTQFSAFCHSRNHKNNFKNG